QYGVVLDAEMLTPVPAYQGLVRLKADVLQQVDQHHFMATGGSVTTSRMGVPKYWFQAGEIQFSDLQEPRIDPLTGQMVIDPFTGQPVMDHQTLATANNIFVYLGGLPVFYWPVIATDASKSTYYIDNIRIDRDSVFGTQLRTDWDLFQLLGRSPAPGAEWTAALDLLSDRGVGFGTDFKYSFADPFNPAVQHTTQVHAWGISDDGTDNLGLGRRAVTPEESFRGRVFGQHRSYLPSGLIVSAEVGFVSDRNFLEQYYEQEWDQWKDQTTGVELKYLRANQSIALASDVQVNDFFTQTEWLPRFDYIHLGQSLLRDRLTWHGHSHAGYGRVATATTPTNFGTMDSFTPLGWEPTDPQPSLTPGDREGVRVGTRQEIDMPVNVGPVKLVPYALGDITHWGEDLNGVSDTRMLGQVGVRGSLSVWKSDPTVYLPLLNVNGLAHKVTVESEFLYADSDRNLTDLTLYDPLDDDATEAFRHRMMTTSFPGGIPLTSNERMFALRTGMQSDVTPYSMEIGDDLMLGRVGLRQRWQTKRGAPGYERTIDWITPDVGGTVFPKADENNFGETVGLVDYNFRWHVGDRFTVMSDGFYDFFAGGLMYTSLGATLTKPQVGTVYAGVRTASGPIESTVVTSSFTYRMSDKWLASGGASYDFGTTGNIGSIVSLTRIGESFLLTMGVNYDASRDNFGVRFLLEPRFLASGRTRIAGEPLPPVGLFGLE
ncbi:MAG: hypothetical protein KDA41_07645, partial [Planctomycetales bacterium]|nr:hypothetical protein [Planctomycetales bacterium]